MNSHFPSSGAVNRTLAAEMSGRPAGLGSYAALILVVVLLTVEVFLLLTDGNLAVEVAVLLPVFGVIAWRARNVAPWASGGHVGGGESAYWSSNRAAFLDIGNRMIAECRRANQTLSVIVFEQSDLPQLQCTFGAAVAQQMAAKLAGTLQSMVKSNGLAVRTDPTVFAVLLPGFGRDRALALVKEAFGNAFAIEFDVGGDDVVLVPDFLIQTVRREATSIKDVYSDMRKTIKRSQ